MIQKQKNSTNSRGYIIGLVYLFTRGSAFGAFLSFLLSLVSAIFQITAFILIAIFVRLLEDESVSSFFGLYFQSNEKTLLLFALLIPSVFTIGVVLRLTTLTWITREGRIFFDKLAELTFSLARERQIKDGSLAAGDISALIKYDVRFASVSFMYVLRIFYPIFVSSGILVFAYFFEAFLTKVIVMSILLTVPLHIFLIKWGNRTADRIRDGAIRRSKEVDVAIGEMFSYPNAESVLNAHSKSVSKSVGHKKFMKAYVDRQRLSGYSSAISDVTMLLAIVAILWITLNERVAAELTISNLIIAIGSLHPFFINLQNFISYKSAGKHPIKLVLSGSELDVSPFSISIMTFKTFSPWTALAIGRTLNYVTIPFVLTASFTMNTKSNWSQQIGIDVRSLEKNLEIYKAHENVVFSRIMNFLDEAKLQPDLTPDTWSLLPIACRLTIMALAAPDDVDTFLLNATDCQSLSDAEWLTLKSIIGDKNMVFVYNSSPRRLRFGVGGQIGVLNESTLKVYQSRVFDDVSKDIRNSRETRKMVQPSLEELNYNF